MIPYLILIFLPLIFLFVSLNKRKGRLIVEVGFDNEIQDNSLLIPVFFILFFIILALRDESIGVDLTNYRRHFESISYLDIKQTLNREGDVLYNILVWVITRVTQNYRIFLSFVAAIILVPISIFYSKDRDHGFLKLITFINMPTFIMIFSGLRQAIAFSVGTIAYKYVKEKKLLWFLFWTLIAVGFHHSAFIMFAFYPLYHITFRKKHLWFIVPSIVLLYVFNKQIFGAAIIVSTLLFGNDYSIEISNTGAYTMLILFVLFAIFSYIIPDESLMDKETLGLRNFLLAAVVLQCFVPLHPLAMRMNYYYIIFILFVERNRIL